MNVSAPFIRRPIATALLTAAVVLAGVVAFLQLPMAPLPQVDFPTIDVSATLPGASPDIMASSVAAPLERQFAHMGGLTEMTSASYLGSTSITLQFDLSRNIDGAARDVEAAINAARANLPSNLPNNPTYRKVNPAEAPILIIALTSDIHSPGQLYDAASTIIQQRLLQIEGVGQVNIGGGALPAVRVETNPTQLNNAGLSLEDVRMVLAQQNANIPKGQLSDERTTSDILANDQLFKAKDYEPLIVAYRNGAPVRLSDIASVRDSVENIRAAGYLNGKRAVLLIVFRQPGANIVNTVDRVKAALPWLKASIPSAINTTIVLDRTTTIRASILEVERTLIIAVLLVVLVVFAFLRNGRATLIPAVVVPTSLIGTFGVMYLLGYSLDNLSLMALTIATGFVVDDAIVVIENISRYLEKGMRPMEAALKGAREVGFTVLSISISLVAVFTPILLMGGIVGRLFREFAVTLSTAILVSLAISLTTTPMMCARLLRQNRSALAKATTDGQSKRSGPISKLSQNLFARIAEGYKRSLQVVLRHPAITLGVLLATMAATVFLFIVVPKGFFPEQDNGTIFGGMQGVEDASFQEMQAAALRVSDIIKTDPAVSAVVTSVGGTGPASAATNSGFVYAALKPLEERQITAGEVINRLRPKLAAVPSAMVFLQAGQDLRIGGRASNAQYQYTIQSENLNELVKWGPIVLAEIRKLHGFTDVNSDQQNAGLEASLNYDRQTAARLGISAQLIDDTLYDAFGQRQVSTIFTSLNQYHVVLEVDPHFWQNPKGLEAIYLRPANGSNVTPSGAEASSQATPAAMALATSSLSALISLTLTPMMCSRLLKQKAEQKPGRLYEASERVFQRVIEFYARTLQWVLKRQKATLLVAAATLVLTVLLYLIVPKGLFPVQDTGIIQGISEAAQNISFTAMAEKQQALADVVLKDPAVESLSSFIGIDGTNTTLNSGRMLINLKPLDERKISASDVMHRLQPELEKVDGITLYMQPVQDLTVEDRVSRTQFQYTLEDASAGELDTWTNKLVQKLQTLPELRDVATDQQALGSQAKLVIDRHRFAAGYHAASD